MPAMPRKPVRDDSTRRDGTGRLWKRAEADAEVLAIVGAVHGRQAAISRRTTFTSLGWDRWYRLNLVAPVRQRFAAELSHSALLAVVRTVADLQSYVWSLLAPFREDESAP
jgi:hypothetical protein